jgi:hypothetical protein
MKRVSALTSLRLGRAHCPAELVTNARHGQFVQANILIYKHYTRVVCPRTDVENVSSFTKYSCKASLKYVIQMEIQKQLFSAARRERIFERDRNQSFIDHTLSEVSEAVIN